MKTNRKKRHAAISALLALLLLGTMGLAVSADSTLQLQEGTVVNGVLPGNAAGSFAGYTITYPGDLADLRIDLTLGEVDPAYSPYMGLNVYGAYEFEANGVAKDDGTIEVSYREEEAAELFVQVYNYSLTTVPYELTVSGLTTEEEVIVEVATQSATSGEVQETSVSGSVVGSVGGAFGEHPIANAGGESDVTVQMTFSPSDPSFADAFGFEIWDPAGEHVASGVAPEADCFGTLWATFCSDVAGDYVVQVFNYADGVTLNYALTTVD